MNPRTDTAPPAEARKPRLSLLFATACYVGYLPKAPGTWGSLIGVAIYWFVVRWWNGSGPLFVIRQTIPSFLSSFDPKSFRGGLFLFSLPILFVLVVALLGVVASSRVATYIKQCDPQFVVIDEVSGVVLGLLLGLGISIYPPSVTHNPDFVGYAFPFYRRMLNWKYLALGLILFRVFDICKPFPARQAESLPGGWGIMADDWVAAIYAAIGIWIARALGL